MPSIESIVQQLRQDRDRLDAAISALTSLDGSTRPASATQRTMSASARARISRAQKARWKKQKSISTPNVTTAKRTMSAAARRKIAAAQRARWARVKKAA